MEKDTSPPNKLKKPSMISAYGNTKEQQKMVAEKQRRVLAAAQQRRLVLQQREQDLTSFVNAVVGAEQGAERPSCG
jgi:hypothetical protein